MISPERGCFLINLSKKEFQMSPKKLLLRITLFFTAIAILLTIVPALLNSQNDFGVIVGVGIVLTVIVFVFVLKPRELLEWFRDLENEE
jgi:cytochrome c biogenesis protein CcdA